MANNSSPGKVHIHAPTDLENAAFGSTLNQKHVEPNLQSPHYASESHVGSEERKTPTAANRPQTVNSCNRPHAMAISDVDNAARHCEVREDREILHSGYDHLEATSSDCLFRAYGGSDYPQLDHVVALNPSIGTLRDGSKVDSRYLALVVTEGTFPGILERVGTSKVKGYARSLLAIMKCTSSFAVTKQTLVDLERIWMGRPRGVRDIAKSKATYYIQLQLSAHLTSLSRIVRELSCIAIAETALGLLTSLADFKRKPRRRLKPPELLPTKLFNHLGSIRGQPKHKLLLAAAARTCMKSRRTDSERAHRTHTSILAISGIAFRAEPRSSSTTFHLLQQAGAYEVGPSSKGYHRSQRLGTAGEQCAPGAKAGWSQQNIRRTWFNRSEIRNYAAGGKDNSSDSDHPCATFVMKDGVAPLETRLLEMGSGVWALQTLPLVPDLGASSESNLVWEFLADASRGVPIVTGQCRLPAIAPTISVPEQSPGHQEPNEPQISTIEGSLSPLHSFDDKRTENNVTQSQPMLSNAGTRKEGRDRDADADADLVLQLRERQTSPYIATPLQRSES